MKHKHIPGVAVVVLSLVGGVLEPTTVHAQSSDAGPRSRLDAVQVTATRFGEPVQDVPGSIGIATGDELRARGATDLRTALALLAGVSVAPGGDAGPAGAVPHLLGVREVDDLLLLIDGIPAGGAFVPQVEAVSLNNVERIEVLRGAAPVFFGTTAFAGTINVIHYAAGHAESAMGLRYGSYGSVGVSGSAVLSSGEVRQSVRGELSDDKLSDKRAGHQRAEGSWRLASELARGSARADVNLLRLRQKPTSPMPIDTATGQFSALLPLDFNQNPTNARLDTDRYQLVLGYELPLSVGRWGITLSYTKTHTDSVRGFIDMGDTPQPWTARTHADLEAYQQSLRLSELFIDSHLTSQPIPALKLTTGVNLLLGRAQASSLRYGLKLPLDGVSSTPDTGSVAPKGTVDLADRRRFLGLYMQSRYELTPSASLLAGLRWNSTHESRDETRINSRGVVTPTAALQDIDRLSGSIGAQWKAWQSAAGPIDTLTLHAGAGNTFQPAQLDFGPNPEAGPEGGGLLEPETQRSLVAGIKAEALNGMAEIDIDGFIVGFFNQPTQGVAVGGAAVLRSAGQQRYKGIDVDGSLRPAAGWTVKANVTWSDARYRNFLTDVDGTSTQLAGRRQILAPRLRASAGLVYAPDRGWRGSLTTAYTGPRYLDSLNTMRIGGYQVIDASLGYRFDRMMLTLAAANLTDRRDPTLLSELGEGQFYRMSARRFDVLLSVPFR